jgi:hypothetical protein
MSLVVEARQLAIGHVQEVRISNQLAKQVPGGDMRGVVRDVATVRGEVDGHPAVVGDRQRVEQLFQVRPMSLAVAPGDGRRRPATAFAFLGRIAVGPVKRDRGRIIV